MTHRGYTVYFDDLSTNVRQVLSLFEDIIPVDDPEDASMLWLRDGYRESYGRLGRYQLLNHVPGEEAMTRKGDLTDILHRHAAANPGAGFSHADFYKETYRLFDPEERRAFLRQLPAEDSEENLWILKPSTLSRGIGVKVLWQLAELRAQLAETSKMTLPHDGAELEYIIQRYIRDVLLLRGRKSEIRVYWAILSIDPLQVVMYPEGTVRLTLQKFELGDYDNPLVHLANVYQQKQHPEYRPDIDLKWDFATLQDYLENELRLCGARWVEQTLTRRLKRCLAYVARAARDRLRERALSNGACFGLYGADVILDRQLTPWITEIQKGPGLSHSDNVKARVIPPMLMELIRVAFEVQDRVREGSSPNAPLDAIERFEWVVREGDETFVEG